MGAGDLPSSEEASRRRVAAIADELAERATPRHVADEVTKTAVKETKELTRRALSHPLLVAALWVAAGAVIDAAIHSIFTRRKKVPILVELKD